MAKMFKRFISLLALLVLTMAFVFAGCATYVPPTGGTPSDDKPGEGQGDTDKPTKPTPSADSFSVQLMLVDRDANKTPFTSQVYKDVVNMEAQWTDLETRQVYSAKFDENGFAEYPTLDGDYTVNILNVPESYIYDVNGYEVNNYSKEITVSLYVMGILGQQFNNLDTPVPYYKLTKTGVYRTVLESESHKVLFQFQPSEGGTYSFTTLVDITADEINPRIDVHGGHNSWMNPSPMDRIDGGGKGSGYTKNVYWEITLAPDEVTGVFWFMLYSESRNKDAYPLTVDFKLQRDGDFENRYPLSTPAEVTEDFTRTPETPSGTFRYCATRGGAYRLLDQSMVRLNPDDGYYYYFDKVTNEYKEMLYAKISQPTEVTFDSDEYSQNKQNGSFIDQRLLMMLTYVVGYDSSTPLNYVTFVQTYAEHCNADGCYPVNKEIKDFLQRFAVSRRYFNDGNGEAEFFAGYNSDEESQWMYACGFYQ